MKITVFRGTSYPVTYNHTDSTGPVSLVGATVYFTVKSDVYDSDAADTSALIKKTITTHTNAAGGITGWQLSDVDTYIEPGKYHFAVLVETPDGRTEPPSIYGDFVVKGQPSNRQVSNG